jgi:hypothetical protein
MRLFRTLLLLPALTLFPLSSAQADLIVNGGFEAPDIPTGTFAIFGAIPGWATSVGPGIEIQDHVAGSPFEGAQHVELDSTANSGMIQTVITTIPGHGYHFSYAYSPRRNVPADSNTVDVFFNGALIATHSISGIGLTDTSWTLFTHHVTAVGAASTVEFRAGGFSNSLGGYLDAVQFVPEPVSVLLMGIGIAGFARWRRARTTR